MSKAEIQTTGFFTESEFTCWRESVYEKFYPCKVSKQEGNYVSLSMGDMSYSFDDALAEDIARCILDADLVTVGKLYGYRPKPAMRDSEFDSWY